MKELDYYNFLEEADCLMKKYKEEQKELTEEIFLNFLKEMIKKKNMNIFVISKINFLKQKN
ncbi:hypothetical protein [Campylobacter armoricus]|uniref:hypothetical protein n=1 Tax=Campylobacter armoricus TaxID=2505970 RepID=UPI0011166638|nr:hypothetical protein [Campylobacter armoricus]